MGVTTITEQHAFPVVPARMFKAMFTDAKNVLPNSMPQHVKNIEVEGTGGPGSICKTVFNEDCPVKSMKHRIDSFDSQNLTCKYTLTEGDILGDKLESISYFVKIEPSGSGGCVVKTTCDYHTKGNINLKVEDIKAGKANAREFPMLVGDCLHKNASLCA